MVISKKVELLNTEGLNAFSRDTLTDYDKILIEKMVNGILQNYPTKKDVNTKHKYVDLMLKSSMENLKEVRHSSPI